MIVCGSFEVEPNRVYRIQYDATVDGGLGPDRGEFDGYWTGDTVLGGGAEFRLVDGSGVIWLRAEEILDIAHPDA